MKKMIVAVLVLASSVAAQANDYSLNMADEVVDYLSWCDQNKVVSMDDKGQMQVKADCSDEGLSCKTIQRRTVNGTYYYGACVKN
ncbi:MAG: hypothetical protein ACLGGX_11875 [Bdellovibrionia bacterium]